VSTEQRLRAVMVSASEPRRRTTRMRVLRVAIALALAAALGGYYVGIPALRVWQATRVPNLLRPEGPPSAAPAGYHEVAFTTSDGLTLRGWYRPSESGAAVVLTHGYALGREHLLPQADILATAGFGVLTYDLRAHGASDGTVCTRGWLETEDVLAAVAFLAAQPDVDPARIGAFGFSIGGQATLRAAARSDAIRAVVADGPVAGVYADEPRAQGVREQIDAPAKRVYYAVLGVMPGAEPPPPLVVELRGLAPRPLLLIAAGGGLEQRQAQRYVDAAGDTASIWEIPEAGHGGGLASRPEEYGRRLTEHFRAGLRP